MVTEHVSDATLKQIEYFMYAVPPPLTSGEVHRRLLIAGEPASRTRTPASDVTQLSRINSRGTDPGGGLGLSRGTDRARLEGLGASAYALRPSRVRCCTLSTTSFESSWQHAFGCPNPAWDCIWSTASSTSRDTNNYQSLFHGPLIYASQPRDCVGCFLGSA